MYGGCNDVNNLNVKDEIEDMAILCRDYGVNDIIISALIYRRGKLWNETVKSINFLLKLISKENGYFLIGNSNTEIRDLWKDGINL